MRVVFVDPGGRSGALVEERLDHTTERHLVALSPPPLAPGDPISALAADASLGLVVALAGGCPNRAELKLLKRGLALQGPDTDDMQGTLRHSGDHIHFSKAGLEAHGARWFALVYAQLFAQPALKTAK